MMEIDAPQERPGEAAEDAALPAWCAAPPRKLMAVALSLVALLFLISLFKNISHPLFWADESMTAVGASRVLKYGYPKVHDGKNVFYDLQQPDKTLGVDPKTDAYIGGAAWGQYYVAALGVKLAEMSDDMYVRTGILRVLFALFGLGGLIMWAATGAQLFHRPSTKMSFLLCFGFLTLISVPLALHLREVRYYPLTVLLTAIVGYLYLRRCILHRMSFPRYAAGLTLSLVTLYMVFSPAYVAFLVALGAGECLFLAMAMGRRGSPGAVTIIKSHLPQLFPLLASLIVAYPLMLYFDTFHVSRELSQFYASVFHTSVLGRYVDNLSIGWRYFTSFELLYLAMFLKASLLLSYALERRPQDRAIFDAPRFRYSLFLAILLVVYFLVVAKIPNFLFSRYLIPLQPVLSIMIILDGTELFRTLSSHRSRAVLFCKRLLVPICAGFVLVSLLVNLPYIEGHAYELIHRYEGPLDSVIPFIKKQYPDTERLVIATNYEETSFMYYLNAKVVVGYVGYDIEQDAAEIPDVIIYRRYWQNYLPVFATFLARSPYGAVEFPIFDYPFNNLPELNWAWPIMHQFRTLTTDDELRRTTLFLRRPDNGR